MATTKTVDLRKLADDELETRLAEYKTELFNLRFQSATGQLESHGIRIQSPNYFAVVWAKH